MEVLFFMLKYEEALTYAENEAELDNFCQNRDASKQMWGKYSK